ncbi:hypothetical protein [Arthrobacter sp. HLT1-21]
MTIRQRALPDVGDVFEKVFVEDCEFEELVVSAGVGAPELCALPIGEPRDD